jgi:uncharacterized protein (DUF3084 family)
MLNNLSFTLLLIFLATLLLALIASKSFTQNSTKPEKIQEKLKVTEQELKKAYKTLKSIQREKEKLSKELQLTQEKTINLQSENVSLQKEKTELENDNYNLRKELQTEKETSSNLKAEKDSLRAQLIDLEANKQALIEELSGVSGETETELLTWVWMIAKVKSLILEKNTAQIERDKAFEKELVSREKIVDLNKILKLQSDEFNKKENELHGHLHKFKLENKSLVEEIKNLEGLIEELQKTIANIQKNRITTSHSTSQFETQSVRDKQRSNSDYESREITIREQLDTAVEQTTRLLEDKEKLRKEFTASLLNNDDSLLNQVHELEAFVEYLEYRLEKLSCEFDKLDFLERLMNQAGSNLW